MLFVTDYFTRRSVLTYFRAARSDILISGKRKAAFQQNKQQFHAVVPWLREFAAIPARPSKFSAKKLRAALLDYLSNRTVHDIRLK